MTQCERVLKYLEDFVTINPLRAMTALSVMRFPARVADLKKDGYQISRRMASGRNRYGDPVSFAEYRLEQTGGEINGSNPDSHDLKRS